jgi:hypothetical protein
MSQAISDFIEHYLLKHGYPLSEMDRARARKALARHFELLGLTEAERTPQFDRKMGIDIRWRPQGFHQGQWEWKL